jgi:N-acetylneuraminic acid mutarotase
MITLRAFTSGVLLYSCLAIPTTLSAEEGWQDSKPIEVARSHLNATTFHDEIYVAGGAGLLGPEGAFELYDPLSDYWMPLPSLPGGREQFGMAASANRIFVSGGFMSDGAFLGNIELWSYEPEMRQWNKEPDMPGSRAAHSMVTVDDKLYVFGGIGDKLKDSFVFDLAERKWTLGPKLPSVRANAVAVLIGRKVYLVGGVVEGGQVSRRVDVLNVDTSQWSRVADIPLAVTGAAIGVLNGEIHLAGGTTVSPRKTSSKHFVFNPQKNQWKSTKSLLTPRTAGTSTTAAGRWYVIGGGVGSGIFALFTTTDMVESFGNPK